MEEIRRPYKLTVWPAQGFQLTLNLVSRTANGLLLKVTIFSDYSNLAIFPSEDLSEDLAATNFSDFDDFLRNFNNFRNFSTHFKFRELKLTILLAIAKFAKLSCR